LLNDKEMDPSSLEGKSWQEIVQDTFVMIPFIVRGVKQGGCSGKSILSLNQELHERYY